MTHVVIGGTSGLGLEFARQLSEENNVIITGRQDPKVDFAEYREFDLAAPNLPKRIGSFVMDLPPVRSLTYAAGFYQEGHITDVSDEAIDNMVDVGGRGLLFFVKKLLDKQEALDELITVTSTSQWTPREFEPVYNFVKAGSAHLSHGLSLDPRISRTRVIGPSGMATAFWKGQDKDTSKMMQPEWVAERMMELCKRDDAYIFARILGANGDLPNRVEEVESRRQPLVGLLRELYEEYCAVVNTIDPGATEFVPYRDEVIKDNVSKALKKLGPDATHEEFEAAMAKTKGIFVSKQDQAVRQAGFAGDIASLFKGIKTSGRPADSLQTIELYEQIPEHHLKQALTVNHRGYYIGGTFHPFKDN